MKRKITITYKNGETKIIIFKHVVAGGSGIEIVPKDNGQKGEYVLFSKLKEATIK